MYLPMICMVSLFPQLNLAKAFLMHKRLPPFFQPAIFQWQVFKTGIDVSLYLKCVA
jgi:hypothetical protein